jgi:hypothetical protein
MENRYKIDFKDSMMKDIISTSESFGSHESVLYSISKNYDYQIADNKKIVLPLVA